MPTRTHLPQPIAEMFIDWLEVLTFGDPTGFGTMPSLYPAEGELLQSLRAMPLSEQSQERYAKLTADAQDESEEYQLAQKNIREACKAFVRFDAHFSNKPMEESAADNVELNILRVAGSLIEISALHRELTALQEQGLAVWKATWEIWDEAADWGLNANTTLEW